MTVSKKLIIKKPKTKNNFAIVKVYSDNNERADALLKEISTKLSEVGLEIEPHKSVRKTTQSTKLRA